MMQINWLIALVITGQVYGSCQESKLPASEPISFSAEGHYAQDALLSLALQTGVPMGIELSQRSDLCQVQTNVSMKAAEASEVVKAILKDTGFSVREVDGVVLVVDPDLTSEEQSLLTHRYDKFPAGYNKTMQVVGVQLTGFMQMEAENVQTFAFSALYNPNAQKVKIGDIQQADTEQIADRIVAQGGGGFWIFGPADASQGLHQVEIYSYADDVSAIKRLGCNSSR